MPGNISGLSETNVLNKQLETGQMEMTTVADAVKDSGATDITLKTNGRDVDKLTEVQEDSCNDTGLQPEAMKMDTKGAVRNRGGTDVTLKNSDARGTRDFLWRNSKACHRGIQTALSTDHGPLKETKLSHFLA